MLKLPPGRLGPALLALADNEYDRDGFRERILELFHDKDEKSVFRGMVIPTLRALGLLLGFEREMRLTGDGALVLAAQASEDWRANLAMRRALALLERARGIDRVWHRTQSSDHISIQLRRADRAQDERDSGDVAGRVSRWLSYLEYFQMIRPTTRGLQRIYRLTPCRISVTTLVTFSSRLRESYRRLAPRAVGEPVLPIEGVHRDVAVSLWRSKGDILLRFDFDEMLRELLRRGDDHVRLQRSMGAEQRLFMYNGVGYEAMSVREH